MRLSPGLRRGGIAQEAFGPGFRFAPSRLTGQFPDDDQTRNFSAGLRPFLPADAPLLAEIFRASITELAADDYSEAQQAAWAAGADDEDAFAARLAGAN